MGVIRLTAAQAVVRYLAAQMTSLDGTQVPLFAGVWAIFGHGNVAGLGEALWHAREALPTFRAHNEQAMTLAAIAYAKASNRRRMMACTTSIGPGALNMVTAAAVAHVNRLPVLLLPGDTFAGRLPDPVLQQVEHFGDPTVTANDCFRPVSRWFDRITRPEQLLTSLPRALQVLTDPAECGPVTLCLSQDVQAEAYDYPDAFFAETLRQTRRQAADPDELARAVDLLRKAERPLLVAGGGVLYSDAADTLRNFAERHRIPVAETQAGKGALPWNHPQNVGAVGVTGTEAANILARDADVILAVGTRLQDFTTGSRALLPGEAQLIQLNVAAFDAGKHSSAPLVGDARRTLQDLSDVLGDHTAPLAWQNRTAEVIAGWNAVVDRVTAASNADLPSDAQVLGAVNRQAQAEDVVVCAAGGLPGELHKLWRAPGPGSYHLEYGFSCMGYEIAGGLGVRMARPGGEVFVLVGDGSYLMLNSEVATSVMLGRKLVIVVLDNGGFGCINRLQQACGGAPFNNLFDHVDHRVDTAGVDFAAHARSLGATAEKIAGIADLEAALKRARASAGTYAIVIDTDPLVSTSEGGAWWDVAVPEVSERAQVRQAHAKYIKAFAHRKLV